MLICLRFGNRNALMLRLFLRSSPWPESRMSARRTWGMIGFGPKRTDDWRRWPWEGPTVIVALEVPPAGGNSRLGGTQENQLIPPCSSHQMSISPLAATAESHLTVKNSEVQYCSWPTQAFIFFLNMIPMAHSKTTFSTQGQLLRMNSEQLWPNPQFQGSLEMEKVADAHRGCSTSSWCSPHYQQLRREAASLPKSCLVSVWLKTPGRPRNVLPDCPAQEKAGTEARQEAALMRTGERCRVGDRVLRGGGRQLQGDPSCPEHVTSGGTTARSPLGD